MQIKRTVKIIILSVLTIGVLIAGYIMFQRLNYNKEVFDTNTHDFIPQTATNVLQINRKAPEMMSYFGELQSTISKLETLFSYPIYLISNANETALILKASREQEIRIKEKLEQEIYPNFPAKSLKYKDGVILFYPSNDDKFFACTFHKGIFACSYNYKLIENIIDSNSDNNFFEEEGMPVLTKKMSAASVSNLYIKGKSIKSAYNYIRNGQNIQLDGFGYPGLPFSSNLNDTLPKEKMINYSVIPEKFSTLEIQKNTSGITGLFADLFKPLSYKIYLTDNQSSPVSLIELNQSKSQTLELMNTVERNLTDRIIQAQWASNRVHVLYYGSIDFSEDFFGQKKLIYFTFIDNFLVYSPNQENIVEYLSSKKNPTNTKEHIEINPITERTSVFYFIYGDPKTHTLELFPEDFIIQRNANSTTNIQCRPDNDLMEISVFLNNYE